MDNFEFSTSPFVSYNDSQLGYDGVKDRQRRRPPKKNVYLQDAKLLGPNRQTAIATSQDLVQNFPVVGWAVRKHLDYVSSFNFQANSGNAEVDEAIEAFIHDWSKKRNCDVAGRHNLSRFVRLMEMRRIVDGDVFVARIGGTGPKRGTLQAIEGYRVQQPGQDVNMTNPEEILNWVNGVRINKYGEAQRYCVYQKTM